MGTLTVRENIMFSANLRLPENIHTEQKVHRVQEVIDELGLNKCADIKVNVKHDFKHNNNFNFPPYADYTISSCYYSRRARGHKRKACTNLY
jgi:hypothetical protein